MHVPRFVYARVYIIISGYSCHYNFCLSFSKSLIDSALVAYSFKGFFARCLDPITDGYFCLGVGKDLDESD